MSIRSSIKSFLGEMKSNYNFFKAGRKAEFDEEQKKVNKKTKSWMANIRKGTPWSNLK